MDRSGVPALFASLLLVVSINISACGQDWQIPFAGNSFRTAPEVGGKGLRRNTGLEWSDPEDVWTVYFHVSRPSQLTLSLDASTKAASQVLIRSGDSSFNVTMPVATATAVPIGELQVGQAGYVRLDLQGTSRTGDSFGNFKNLLVRSADADLQLDYVRDNKGNMFYWGRRGPSVHLGYTVPRDTAMEYAYTELTVPEGQDTIGSYFMANGFSEGYFGMQVNSATERRILFSVWSPFETDDPKSIPQDQRIVTLASGPQVHIGEFGNEGSGGQSYLVHPWQADTVCRFLTRVQPDQDTNTTVYTCWFSDTADASLQLIASFRRPQTNTTLKGFHSFLENFDPTTGHITRRVNYGNVWVRDTSGKWHPVTKARLTVDATGDQRHRLDFTGGVDGPQFFLQNCGFFNSSVKAGDRFEVTAGNRQPPSLPTSN
jgi:hypothetical protein